MADEGTIEQPPELSVEDLKKQLAERDAQIAQQASRLDTYDRTLKALGEREPARAEPVQTTVAATAASDTDLIRALVEQDGYTEEQARAYLPLVRRVLQHEARPVLAGVVNVAERTALLEAQTSVEDWNDIKDEAVKVMTDYRRRGTYLAPADAALIARAKLGPRKTEERNAETAQIERDRTKHARATGSPSGVQKAGPAPTKEPARGLSKDDLARMTPEAREKALLDALEHVTF